MASTVYKARQLLSKHRWEAQCAWVTPTCRPWSLQTPPKRKHSQQLCLARGHILPRTLQSARCPHLSPFTALLLPDQLQPQFVCTTHWHSRGLDPSHSNGRGAVMGPVRLLQPGGCSFIRSRALR